MSAFAMTGAAAPAKIAAKYNLGRNSKALNAKGEYKWHPWICWRRAPNPGKIPEYIHPPELARSIARTVH